MEHGWILGMHISWWVLLILLGILFLVFFEAKPRKKKNGIKSENLPPLEILKRRYAAGEINTEEYKERKTILEEDSAQIENSETDAS
jgi:putative membrane protein